MWSGQWPPGRAVWSGLSYCASRGKATASVYCACTWPRGVPRVCARPFVQERVLEMGLVKLSFVFCAQFKPLQLTEAVFGSNWSLSEFDRVAIFRSGLESKPVSSWLCAAAARPPGLRNAGGYLLRGSLFTMR